VSSLIAFLDVLIVLTAIYATLSTVVSWVNEQISHYANLRGATLYEGVINLVMGEKTIADQIFQHPLVVASSNDPGGIPNPAKPYRPPYLDARNFSMALWQSVQATQQRKDGATAAQLVALPADVVEDLRQRVATVGNANLRGALTALLDAAGSDYQRLLVTTDNWFNAQMDRVSGWYKRRVQWIIAFIGILLVVVTGLDSVEIATRLYANPESREQVVRAIEDAVPSAPAPVASSPGPLATLPPRAYALNAQAESSLVSFFHLPWQNGWRHVPGMLMTMLALILGGPFWFQLLCTLVNVRSTGRRPERDDQPG
jgi:hypothetical protein